MRQSREWFSHTRSVFVSFPGLLDYSLWLCLRSKYVSQPTAFEKAQHLVKMWIITRLIYLLEISKASGRDMLGGWILRTLDGMEYDERTPIMRGERSLPHLRIHVFTNPLTPLSAQQMSRI
jgi:hypothetical protein